MGLTPLGHWRTMGFRLSFQRSVSLTERSERANPQNTMSEFVRIKSPHDPYYADARALYAQSFPYHEQREAPSQDRILSDPAYHFEVMLQEGTFAGIVLYWEGDSFLYVEHLAIDGSRRNQGLGKQALGYLQAKGKTVILEIDPPIDAISQRRQGFYERSGFVANPYPHVHPAYHSGYRGHDLVVMSSPKAISADEYQAFNTLLISRVMHAVY